MGRPKALLPLSGRPLVAHHIEILSLAAHVIMVVTGGHADAIGEILPSHVRTVHNDRWRSTSPIDSLKLALRALPGADRVLVTPIDVLPASEETLARLLSASAPAVPVAASGERGHPVLLGPNEIARALAGDGDREGLRSLLAGASLVPVEDPLVSLDFDDEAAFREASARFSERLVLQPLCGEAVNMVNRWEPIPPSPKTP